MAQCIYIDVNGFLIADSSIYPSCTGGMVALTTAEFQEIQASLANDFLSLTLADGALIAGAILAVWATGYAIRVLIRVLKHTDENIT